MLRRAAGKLALVAVSVGLVLALAEVVLRAWPGLIGREVLLEFDRSLRARVAARLGLPRQHERRCLGPEERADAGPELCLFVPGTLHRFDLEPEDRAAGAIGEVRLDGRGFCNPPHAAARERADVVAVGDSFTACTAVAAEDTWPARLEARTGLAVQDLGVPGVGLHEYVEVLARDGLAFEPRVVVVGVYGGNDLRDALRFREHLERGGRPRERDAGFAAPLLRHSYALSFVRAAGEVLAQRWTRPEIDFGFEIAVRGHAQAMNQCGSDLDEVRVARALAAGRADPVREWDAPLERLADLARERGLRVVVAYLPAAHSAYAPSVRFADAEIGALVSALDEAQRNALPALAERHGLAFVDCTPALRAAAPEAELAYFPGNLHPTAAGHAMLAACVAPAVQAALRAASPSGAE